ncbi:DUF721 domain-containing protein [Halalkalibaculum sp. DA3122]|uniref:DUF721 domain-containing protein n=1 Tax=unclassified Halalkalibaculum TaxID=2964617 RepID=UPI003754E22A
MARFSRNKPKALKDLLKNFLDDYPHKNKLKRGMILSIWSKSVGEKIAEKTDNIYFKDGKLIIHVKDPAWRHEIHMQRFQIQKKLNREVGDKIVKEIVVRS